MWELNQRPFLLEADKPISLTYYEFDDLTITHENDWIKFSEIDVPGLSFSGEGRMMVFGKKDDWKTYFNDEGVPTR